MTTDYSSLLPEIREALPKLGSLHAMLGFDGTVDVICKPVESRAGIGKEFIAFSKMRDFGQRVIEADGKSAMVEIVNELQKIGGNGPIMANALARAGTTVDYIGPLGQPETHPVYKDFAEQIQVHSIAQPAVTHALEFSNGKLMLSSISSYDEITADTLERQIGNEAMVGLIQKSQLCCLLNWTCLPGLNSILNWYLETLLPTVGPSDARIFFFDLADPSMRSYEDLLEVLGLIGQFEAFGRVTLGMNLNEAQQVCRALEIPEPASEHESLCQALASIREKLSIHTAMAHPTDFAACATPAGSRAVVGPHTESPVITTGAGDHLNAGFCLAQLLEFSPEDALKIGVLFSGYYVRKAKPPTLVDIPEFISDLKA
jgi:sugar/nucleoside kinase (ribokinase family)